VRRALELPINIIIILVIVFFVFTIVVGFVPKLLGGTLGKLGRISAYTQANSVTAAQSTCQTWCETAKQASSPQQFLTSTYCTKKIAIPASNGCWPSPVNAGGRGEWLHPCGGSTVSETQCGARITNFDENYKGNNNMKSYDPGCVSADDLYKECTTDNDLCVFVPAGLKVNIPTNCWGTPIETPCDTVIFVGDKTYDCGVRRFYVKVDKGKVTLFHSNNGGTEVEMCACRDMSRTDKEVYLIYFDGKVLTCTIGEQCQ